MAFFYLKDTKIKFIKTNIYRHFSSYLGGAVAAEDKGLHGPC